MTDSDKPEGDKDEPSETRRSLHGPMVFLGMIGIIAGVMISFAYAASDGTAFDGLLDIASNNVVAKSDDKQDAAQVSADIDGVTGNAEPESSTIIGGEDGAVPANDEDDSKSFATKEQNKDYNENNGGSDAPAADGTQAPIQSDNGKPEVQPAPFSRDPDAGETSVSNEVPNPGSINEKTPPITRPDDQTEQTTVPQTANHPTVQEPNPEIVQVPEHREEVKQQPSQEPLSVTHQEPTISQADDDKDEKNLAGEKDNEVQTSDDDNQQLPGGKSDDIQDKDLKGILGMVHRLVPQLKEKVGDLVPSSNMMIGQQGNYDEKKVKDDSIEEGHGHRHDDLLVMSKDDNMKKDSDEEKDNPKHGSTKAGDNSDNGKQNAEDKINEHKDNKGNSGGHNKDRQSDKAEIELKLPVGLDNIFGMLTFR